jgi:predicted component of type VI protein secretion system
MPALIYIDESHQRTEFPLEARGMVVGRDPHSDVRIDEDDISAQHASINIENGKYVLRDHSVNGVFINGEKAVARVLIHHDVIRFGRHLFLVSLIDTPAPVPVPAPLPAQTVVTVQARPSAVGHRVARLTPIAKGATRLLPTFAPAVYPYPPLYAEPSDKVNNRELVLFICLGILVVLVCYFGYLSYSHEESKTNASAATEESSPN